MTLGRQVFPAPISRARRNASVQPWTSGLVGRLVPGLAALGGGVWTLACAPGSGATWSSHPKAPALTLLGPVMFRNLHPEL